MEKKRIEGKAEGRREGGQRKGGGGEAKGGEGEEKGIEREGEGKGNGRIITRKTFEIEHKGDKKTEKTVRRSKVRVGE